MDFIELDELQSLFAILPGITQSSAKRIAVSLLYNESLRIKLITTLKNIEYLNYCNDCNLICNDLQCEFCSDKNRASQKICLVSRSQDAYKIESLRVFNGCYYLLNPNFLHEESIGINDLEKISKVINDKKIKEIIIATNPTIPEEAYTKIFVSKILKLHPKIILTKLAFGIPIGLNIEYSDKISLKESFVNRKDIKNR